MSRKAWYAEGLRFACARCGACCRGEPGYVWVRREELRDIARFLDVSTSRCRALYLRAAGRRASLRERRNGDCVFWEREAGCTIYAVRPAQCRSYPFWPEILKSRRAWEEEAGRCPGIGEGRLWTIEEIRRIRRGERGAALS